MEVIKMEVIKGKEEEKDLLESKLGSFVGKN